MSKGLKVVVYVLSISGLLGIWCLLNYLSNGNIIDVGLGDYLLTFIGFITLASKIYNAIFYE